MATPPRKFFIAGSTGVVGRAVARLAEQVGAKTVLHVRPKSASKALSPRAVVCDLADGPALAKSMAGCTTVLQLIGTMRKRFSQGDTYQTSDVETTDQLVKAARASGADHFILLSSAGAGRPIGAYLAAKARAEALVKESGLPFTVVRPSAFTGTDERHVPEIFSAAMRLFGLEKYQPIDVQDVARVLVHAALTHSPEPAVLEGRPLWDEVERARKALAARLAL